jgi:orotate phosphoribosyltransferase
MTANQTIIEALFATQAIRVSPADQPFWYTSGTFGPYYINTHFLYGSEAEANQLLALIDQVVQKPLELPQTLAAVILEHYQQQPLFHRVIDQLNELIADLSFDLISGGERRDFFFSIPAAALLGKPHLSILKDGSCYLSDASFTAAEKVEDGSLEGQNVLHVADLVTEASSYLRTWLPAIARLSGKITHTAAIVDRNQGGREALAQAGVELHALARIDSQLFAEAQAAGLINADQVRQIQIFMEDPHQYMISFLENHPAFLTEQIRLGGKTAERARRCLEMGYGHV